MKLELIELAHYRNYDSLQLSFSSSVNVFLGENAQGKTNLLEAIYVLAIAKSPRTTHDKDLIQWEQDYGKIKGRITRHGQSIPLELTISGKGKKAKANHIEKRRLSDYIGLCNVVMFAPEDLNLVKGSPSVRRRFIDMELGQIAPVYMHHLGDYQKVLQQRNALLRKSVGKAPADTTFLDILTDRLISLASEIVKRRLIFVAQLNEWAAPIQKEISHGMENLSIVYESSVPEVLDKADSSKIEEAFRHSYERLKKRELDRGTTLFGPHRDELRFFVNDKDVQAFGSQGQQRTTALSVKLAEIELINHEVGEYPILLLDDVLSELDDIRKTHLLGVFQEKVQTFVTTTSVDGLDHALLDRSQLFYIHQGQIKCDE
ncbi:DNA replication/repair protein RecF [Sporolactobacillus terrae]|uniref:DNA replication and repair protein RecF n=1 Tax=Sporolactobacillus terrae TaxID=269673 RepID=A0A410D4Y9_9BACL|nr:DNA replication/repair protein RecF [Sporolactobacillus terrae]QAA21165.1 DNA replication and repair protein RecF [Sporolactobacillus terrae]QAA24138.1 DNA replication and repair protein RecF [Sporolactobacillus terrae]UAK15947.1 DNA replication/repair protein RecF [Sporolactobacillus terrae]BBN97299.1 DNA replication and repair protein RecF [Sporolactobacillus terrae]